MFGGSKANKPNKSKKGSFLIFCDFWKVATSCMNAVSY
jgi:hypothetical protein